MYFLLYTYTSTLYNLYNTLVYYILRETIYYLLNIYITYSILLSPVDYILFYTILSILVNILRGTRFSKNKYLSSILQTRFHFSLRHSNLEGKEGCDHRTKAQNAPFSPRNKKAAANSMKNQ